MTPFEYFFSGLCLDSGCSQIKTPWKHFSSKHLFIYIFKILMQFNVEENLYHSNASCGKVTLEPACPFVLLLAIHLRQVSCYLTLTVSSIGLWAGPPPTFSGLKVVLCWHMKGGFKIYPHWPFCRNLPWFRSICSPGVWKFKAAEENTVVSAACILFITVGGMDGVQLDQREEAKN